MRIERLVTAAPGREEFTNNVWIVSGAPGGEVVVVVDPAHDAEAIAAAVGGRRVSAIVITHGHWDHVGGAVRLRELTGAPVLLHPADRPLWRETHPSAEPDRELRDALSLPLGAGRLEVRHTPGHTPGSCSVVVWTGGEGGEGAEAGAGAPPLGVLTGDTLFQGGPGATRWEYSSFPLIIDSIRERLLTLPPNTPVHTGHGPDTTIGAEAADVPEWIARGW